MCIVFKRLSNNDYQLELLERLYISPTCNVVVLYVFHEGEKGDDEGTLDECEQHLPINQTKEMDEILETRIGWKTHEKEYIEYLVE